METDNELNNWKQIPAYFSRKTTQWLATVQGSHGLVFVSLTLSGLEMLPQFWLSGPEEPVWYTPDFSPGVFTFNQHGSGARKWASKSYFGIQINQIIQDGKILRVF